jgi:ATP-dependent RNA helicase HelY
MARGVFHEADAAEIIEALSWFCYDRDRAFYNRFRLPPGAWDIRERMERVQDRVIRAESEAGVRLTPGFTGTFVGIAYSWCQGLEFAELLNGVGLPEGDIMLTFAKTLDLVRQVRGATRVVDPKSPLLATLAEGERLMRRGIVALCVGAGLPALPAPEETEVEVDARLAAAT